MIRDLKEVREGAMRTCGKSNSGRGRSRPKALRIKQFDAA